MRKRAMHLRGNGDDPGLELLGRLPPQGVGQRRPVGWRIPLHEHQIDRQIETPSLVRQPVDEELHALEKVATVIVIAGGRDDAQLRWAFRLAHARPVVPAATFNSVDLRHRTQ